MTTPHSSHPNGNARAPFSEAGAAPASLFGVSNVNTHFPLADPFAQTILFWEIMAREAMKAKDFVGLAAIGNLVKDLGYILIPQDISSHTLNNLCIVRCHGLPTPVHSPFGSPFGVPPSLTIAANSQGAPFWGPSPFGRHYPV